MIGGFHPDELVSVTEASRRAGVTLRTFERWLRQGRLKRYRPGGVRPGRRGEAKTYVNATELAELLAERDTIHEVEP